MHVNRSGRRATGQRPDRGRPFLEKVASAGHAAAGGDELAQTIAARPLRPLALLYRTGTGQLGEEL